MSGVRTEWHLADLTDTESDDPFGVVAYSTGVELDLRASEEELAAQVVTLLQREERLAQIGLTCSLKDAGQDCLTCPQATLDPEERRSVLCRLGKDQSTLEKRHDALNRSRREPLDELAASIDSASELGYLPDELGELLTQAGL